MTQKKKKKQEGMMERSNPFFLFIFLLMVMLVGFIFTSSVMIVLIGMVPTFVAMISDRDADRCLSYCVMLCNICGVIPFVIENIQSGMTMTSGLSILQNPINIIIMMAAAGLGWTAYYVIPSLTISLAQSRDQSKLHYLRQRFFDLREDWGAAIPDSELINSTQSLEPSVINKEREEGSLPSAQSSSR